MAKFNFTPFDEGSTFSFSISFDVNDEPTEATSETPETQEMLDDLLASDPGRIRKGWWMNAYYNTHDIEEVTEGEEEVKPKPEEEAAKFSVAKLDEDKRLVFGWAYVSHDVLGNVLVDKSGEFIDDPEELETAAYEFVIKSRMAGDMHQRDLTVGDVPVQVGTMVESMVFTPEKIAKLGLAPGSIPTGWWVGFKVENETVWKAVKNGERPAFSIHGKSLKEAVS